MKLNYLLILGVITLLTVSCVGEKPSNQTSIQVEPPTTSTAQSGTNATKSSGFVAAAHPTQGTVRVLTENGQRYLEFDNAFKTDQGPDLFVLLHREPAPKSYDKRDYVSLGKLQQVSGTQRYAIPADVNPEDFRSVVIWCRLFNSTFGYASLGT